MSDSERERYELEKLVEEIQQYSGSGTQLVTVYVPPDMRIDEVRAHLQQEKSEAQNIKSKNTRKNVQQALSSLLSQLRYYDEVPETGLALFSGAVQEEDTTDMETIVYENPPRQIESFKYHCDSEFYTEPLEEIAKSDDELFGLIVMDMRDAHIGWLSGGRIIHETHLSSNVPGKHKAGGQSQARFERLRQESIERFYKKIAKRANNTFFEERHELQGILLGGPHPTKEEFESMELLHHEIQSKIIGLFDVADTTERGLQSLVEKAQPAIENTRTVKQKETLDRFFKSLRNEKAVYGFEEVNKYLETGAVDTLLLSKQLSGNVTLYSCPNNHTTPKFSTEIETCPKCGSPINETTEKDIMNYVENLAKNRGTQIELIGIKFEKGKQLLNVFNGIAGILRYDPFN